MPGIDYTIGAKMSGFHAGIQGAMSKITGMAASFAKIAAPLGAIAGVGSLGAALGKAVSEAARMESLETAFMPLLGSARAAKERIGELSRFAAETPFEMPEVAMASRVLETLTRGALSTGEGLRLVGDVAAATGAPFNEIATTIGRLYDGLDSGRPVGEAMMRLQELGVISGDTRGQLEALQAEGVKGADAWAVAAGAMGRFSGGMALQSTTWNGLLSTLKDNIGLAFAAFGAPIIDALKPALDQGIKFADALKSKAEAAGKALAEAAGYIRAAFQTGNIWQIAAAGLKLGFIEAVNTLATNLRAAFSAASATLASSKIPDMIATALTGAGQKLLGYLYEGAAAIASASGMTEKAVKLAIKSGTLSGAGNANLNAAKNNILKIDPVAQAADFKKAFTAAAAAIPELIDSTEARKQMAGLLASLNAQVGANNAAAAVAKAQRDALVSKPAVPVPAASAPPGAQAAARQMQADRLRQIGGYVGRGMDAGRDRIAERTEQWTRKTSESIAKLVTHVTSPKPVTAAGAIF